MTRKPFSLTCLTAFALCLIAGPAFGDTPGEAETPELKILILGGTGFIGPWEVEAARAITPTASPTGCCVSARAAR